MSTPNPLIPQGSFQAQAGKGASNVRIAVATIVAIHVVFFGGLLLQGCKRDTKVASGLTAETNLGSTNLTMQPIDPNSLFYTNANHLPSEGAVTSSLPSYGQTAAPEPTEPAATNLTRDPWKPTNLGATGAAAPQDQTAMGGKEYTVVRGDTFGKIAAANGTTVNAMRKANPNVDPAKLRPGMKVQVPGAANVPSAGSQAPEATGSAASADIYTVKAGDTLTKVAKTHGVTIGQLRAANNLKTSGLKTGQKLKIPAASASGAHEPGKHANGTQKTGSRTNNGAARPAAQ